MPNIFTRIFAYPILERELSNRIADRDAQIVSLKVEIQELRDRLYMRHGFVPSGEKATSVPGKIVPPYRTGRQRLKDMVTPKVELLSDEDHRMIEESVTQ